MIVRGKNFKDDYKYIIFDLDGTLSDTSSGVVDTFKKTLDHFGVDYSSVNFRRYIGPPLMFSFGELLGDRAGEGAELYRKIFKRDDAFLNCKAYDGMESTLKALLGSGKILAIATSKNQSAAEQSVAALGFSGLFHCLYGQTESSATKTEILAELLADKGWDKRQCLMVGDTLFDVEGARNNGVDVLGVGYGFGNGEELKSAADGFVDNPEEIVEILNCGGTL